MRGLWRRVRHAWRCWRYPPVVIIQQVGQATEHPHVDVSVEGIHGVQGVYVWDDDTEGNAKATLYGKGLADIMQRRLIDRREHTHKTY